MVNSLSFRPFIFFYVISRPLRLAVAQCYLPGGSWAPDYVPCNLSAYTSPCCKPGWTCFSNTLCIATDPSVIENGVAVGTAFRPACTNPQWNETVCGNVCLDDPVSDNLGELIPCGNLTWCCEPAYTAGACNCKSGHGTFSVPDGEAITIISVNNLIHTATDLSTASSAAASTTTTQSNDSTETSPSSPSLPTTSTQPTPTHTPVTQTKKFKVGLGVGLSLGTIALLAILFIALKLYAWCTGRKSWNPFRRRTPDTRADVFFQVPNTPPGNFNPISPQPNPYDPQPDIPPMDYRTNGGTAVEVGWDNRLGH